MTTTDTVTLEQVSALRGEAASAGDAAQVAVCDRAIVAMGGWRAAAITRSGMDAICECVRAINYTEAA